MASVFLSYDREDADRARPLALALEKAGHSVWWDRHVKSGAQYSKEIEAELSKADAVVVLWSKQSVESAWVRDEATAGRDSGGARADRRHPGTAGISPISGNRIVALEGPRQLTGL